MARYLVYAKGKDGRFYRFQVEANSETEAKARGLQHLRNEGRQPPVAISAARAASSSQPLGPSSD